MRERTIQLDETDWRIIRALRENARATFTEIGRAVGLTSPAARERVRRMEEAGLIEGYRPVFNYSVMGFGIKAIILMKSKSDSRVAEKHYFRLLPAVRELEGIVRAWDVTGDVVCIAEAAVPSMKELDELLDKLHHFELHTTTYIVFEDTGELPAFPPEAAK